eukprot:tig00021741_g23292.t1
MATMAATGQRVTVADASSPAAARVATRAVVPFVSAPGAPPRPPPTPSTPPLPTLLAQAEAAVGTRIRCRCRSGGYPRGYPGRPRADREGVSADRVHGKEREAGGGAPKDIQSTLANRRRNGSGMKPSVPSASAASRAAYPGSSGRGGLAALQRTMQPRGTRRSSGAATAAGGAVLEAAPGDAAGEAKVDVPLPRRLVLLGVGPSGISIVSKRIRPSGVVPTASAQRETPSPIVLDEPVASFRLAPRGRRRRDKKGTGGPESAHSSPSSAPRDHASRRVSLVVAAVESPGGASPPKREAAPAASRPGPAPRRVSTPRPAPSQSARMGGGRGRGGLGGGGAHGGRRRAGPPPPPPPGSGWRPTPSSSRPSRASRPFNQRWRRRPLRDLVDAAARRAFCQAASTLAVRRPDGSQTACVYAGFLDFDAAGIAPSEKKGLAARAAPLRTLAELFAAEPRLLEPAGTAYRLRQACGAYPPRPARRRSSASSPSAASRLPRLSLRHPPLLVRAPGRRVKADGQVEPAAAGGGRPTPLPGLSEEDVLGIVAAIDRSPLNPNCGLRLDELPPPAHGGGTRRRLGPDLDALIEPDGEAAERVLIAGDGPAPEISAFLSGLFADLERRVGTEEAVAALPALPEAPSAPREGGGASRKRRRDGSPARGGAGSAPEALRRALELAPHHRDRRGAPRKVRLVGRSEDGRYVTFRVSPAAGSGARCHLGVEHDWRGTLCSVSQLLPGASMVAFRCGGQNHSDCARRPVFGRPVWDGARADPAEEAADDAALVALGECLSSIADGARGGGAAPPARTLPYPFSVVPRTNDRVYSVDAPCAECGGARGGVLVDVLAREVKAFPCAGCKAASPEGRTRRLDLLPELGSELRAAEDAVQRALVARALEANGGPGIALFGAAGPKGWLEALPPLGGQAGEQLVAIIEVLRQRVVAKDWSGEPIRRGLVPEAARKALDALPLPDLREPPGGPPAGASTGVTSSTTPTTSATRGAGMLFLRAQTGTGKSQAIVHLLAEMRKSPAAYGL